MEHIVSNHRTVPARGLVARLTQMAEIWRQRRHLARLDAHLLSDIGLSSSQAETEAKRPLWDAPDNWRI